MTDRDGSPSATWLQVAALRLDRQHLDERTTPDRLVDVVRELVGIHAQVMSSAELQVAARIDGLRASDVREALWERRSLAKVWAFRQTLHLLAPDDLIDFVAAAPSLERWHSAAWLRYFGMKEAEVEALIEAVGASLSERPMTRTQLVDAVTARIGKPALAEAMLTGWGTFLAPAAQRGHLIFGPSEGRNVAFVSPSAWLGRRVERGAGGAAEADDALGRLVFRYLAAFPGASREMIARWWGGGRITAVNRAMKRTPDELSEIDVEGTTGWLRRADLPALRAAESPRGVRLLPGFDPFVNELPRRTEALLAVANHDRVHRTAGWVTPVVLVDGRVAGTWEIGGGQDGTVEVQPFERWRGGAKSELTSEVDRIAAFLDRPLKASVAAPLPSTDG
jgi:hypothetical protein